MSKWITSLRQQTWYFKVVFGISTVLLLTVGGYLIYVIASSLTSSIPDAGLGIAAGIIYLVISQLVYWLVLLLCSKRSLLGKIRSGAFLIAFLYAALATAAEVTV